MEAVIAGPSSREASDDGSRAADAIDDDFESYESLHPFRVDPDLVEWRQRLTALSASEVSIRQALPDPRDARRVWDLQLDCPPITVTSLRLNASIAAKRVVLIAEIDGVHVGFCVSFAGARLTDPLFVQVVGVAPAAQQRGIGVALLAAATERELGRDVALATQDRNAAARAMIERFAQSVGGRLERVNLGTFRNGDLGIRRGEGYRAWVIRRSAT